MLRFKKPDGSEYPEWKPLTFADVGSVSMCKRVFKEQTETIGDVPFFKIGTFGKEPDAFISYELFNELKEKYSYPTKGTVLLSASGTLGRTVVFDGNDAYFQDSNIIWLEHDDTILDRFLEYLYAVVHWQEPEGGTIKRLYNKNFLETEFELPCIEEQQKIADCLSSVDAVIDDYEAQVENMQNQKKGVMQKLFSQEVRFKADDGSEYPEWEYKRIDEAFSRFATGLNPRKNFTLNSGGENYYVTIKNFKHGHLALDEKCDKVDDDALELIDRRSQLRKDDMLLASIGRVGDCYLITETPKNWNINESVFSLRPNKEVLYPPYGFHVVHADVVLDKLMSQITGSTFKSIKMAQLKATKMPLPCLEEQQKIADCLTAFDDAIEDLQKTVEHWKNIKKGLLQQLFA